MAIRTPDQRLRVFVSSTLQELAEERRAVREAIEELRLTPVMFELGARPYPPRALYRAYLEQSDVFVGLYWQRYGWVAPGETKSGLEDEYDLAGERPKLIYLKSPAPDREPRLAELIRRIRDDDQLSYRSFTRADELRALVTDDLAVLLSERFETATAASPEGGVGPTSRLPRPPTRLVDRHDDLARLLDLLADQSVRLVTIFGTGGIGKSRLALAVAQGAEDRYPDGVAYVDLTAVNEPPLLLPTIARALGLEEGAETSLEVQLRRRLADARMLIVLDNVERIVDAAEDLSDLLWHTTSVQLLATSRRVLEIRGERVYGLAPLAVPSGEATDSPAVEMFLERARAIDPDYRATPDDLAAFAELARRLDGLPLAIELASARLRTLSPRAILERMGVHRLDFLRSGPRDLPSHQRALRDAIGWSHSMLSPAAQVLFARLAVFIGSASLEAIEQVANPDGRLAVLDLLADLVDESLVRAVGEATEPRFSMLETIREYAIERLEATGEAANWRGRHEAYYVNAAERGGAGLATPEQLVWLERLDRELDNFRAVLGRAIRRDDAPAALRIGRPLEYYWIARERHREARGWMDRIAALSSAGPHERAVAWTIGASVAFSYGDFEPLERRLDEALAMRREGEDRRVFLFAEMLRAFGRGTSSHGSGSAGEVERLARQLANEGDSLADAYGLLLSSMLARLRGELDEARRLADEALRHSKRIGDWYLRGYISGALAQTALQAGDLAQARTAALDALASGRRLGAVNSISYGLELWATAEFRADHVDQAGWLYALAQRGYQQVGSSQWRSDAELHERLAADLLAALGDRLDELAVHARDVDLLGTVDELLPPSAEDHAASGVPVSTGRATGGPLATT